MNFNVLTLGEVCNTCNGEIKTGPFGSQLHRHDYAAEGTPVVMPQDIVDSRVVTENIARVGSEHVERLGQHRMRAGDIVFGRRGDIGRHALITEREEGWICGTGCLRISVGGGILHPLFLHYYLCDSGVIEWIRNHAVGSTMPNLNTSILRSIPVLLPPLGVQQRIAAVLSAYDDLIENNTRRIAILEEMAQALYREWFVNFRFPGHEQVEMVESKLGPVPEGWEVLPVTEAVQFNPRTSVPKEGEKPFVPMGSLSTSGMLIESVEMRSGNSGSKFRNGDTLVARITPCLENGKTAFVQFLPAADAVAFGSTEFIVLRSQQLCPEMVYLLARSDDFRGHAIKSMSGATGRQRVQEAAFTEYLITVPDAATMRRFSGQVAPIFRMNQVLSERNAVLRRTRDLLLPKLISGEVRVEALEDVPCCA